MKIMTPPERRVRRRIETEIVLQRLKKHLGIRTNVELSDILQIKPNTLSTWKKRNTLDYKRILSLCHTYKLDINRLFFSPDDRVVISENSPEKKGFPVVLREAYFPYVTNLDEPSYISSLPRFDFPFISGKGIRAFQVVGSGMTPSLEDGDFVIGEYMEDHNTIVPHHIYVVVSKVKGIFINRVKPDPDLAGYLHLINDKSLASPIIRMSGDEIVELWKVTSVFSLNFIGEYNRVRMTGELNFAGHPS